MRLTELRLDHFRNLVPGTLRVPPEGALLVGDNGQGKTNFLESVRFLSAFRSFRGGRHADAIAFGAGHFRIEATVTYRDGTTRTVAVAADPRRRKIVVDGHEADGPGDARGAVLTVLLRPSDLELVDGGPAVRRRWLDRLLAPISPAYARAASDYDRVLRQRNELLRGSERAAAPVIESWDEALVVAGTPLVVARAALVSRLAGRFHPVAGAVAGAGEAGEYGLDYRPSVGPPDDPAALAAAWRAALRTGYGRDRARGWTGAGPHLDDLALALRGRALEKFGSQGERRTAAVALRLLEAEVLEADTGHRPILLLDDVFTELDGDRAARLLEWLGERHQRFITSPRPLPEAGLPGWTVRAGRIGTGQAA